MSFITEKQHCFFCGNLRQKCRENLLKVTEIYKIYRKEDYHDQYISEDEENILKI